MIKLIKHSKNSIKFMKEIFTLRNDHQVLMYL